MEEGGILCSCGIDGAEVDCLIGVTFWGMEGALCVP